MLGASSANAQTSPAYVQQTPSTYTDYREPNLQSDVPRNNHTYTQVVIIDMLSAIMCQLTGIDPTTGQQTCLDINPANGKLGYASSPTTTQFGQVQETSPQLGGALGAMTDYISVLYTPTVSSSQYTNYLANNFGIVKTANATGAAPATPIDADCQNSEFGYGFCGLQPIFNLWVTLRDIAYAILVIAFVFLGLGVMLRFKVDPRTVMTLQNQIPRVIIAILLITFSYAIAGIMIDLMWTITYAGVNAIASAAPDAKVRVGCESDGANESLQQAANGKLLDQPVSFANRIYQSSCEGLPPFNNSGILSISGPVGDSVSALVISVIDDLMGWTSGDGGCNILSGFDQCLKDFGKWVTGLIVQLIIVVTILIALFRLWYELIKAYVMFFIFVIMGPIWIVMGLIPGRPLGFEKWFRLIFANLAAFPLAAFILVFARVLVDSVQIDADKILDPRSTFVPPLVGNPNVNAFGALMAFGAILIAPSIPATIREKMKVPTSKLGAAAAAGIGAGVGAATAPATKAWKSMNRKNAQTGAPEGVLAGAWDRARKKIPIARTIQARKAAQRQAYNNEQHGGGPSYKDIRNLQKYPQAKKEKRQKLYSQSGSEMQQQMRGRDEAEARAEQERRNRGGGNP